MKRILASLLTILISGSIHAQCCYEPQDYSFYIKAGSGISFSQSANVLAPATTWNPAIEGYNAKLGNQAIGSLAIGCELIPFIGCQPVHLMDLEVGVSTRSTFNYNKLQTADGTPYKREFDLDVTPILFSINLLGQDIPYLNCNIGCGKFYPILGAGVGVSSLLITNFRTTGLPPTGDSSPFASFSTENQYTRRYNFTYTALVGFEYNYNDTWAIATGYRWLDAGKFKGPRFLRLDTGAAIDVAGQEWEMSFRAHEWFVEFKIFI